MTDTALETGQPTERFQMDDAVRAWRRAGHGPGTLTVIDPSGAPELLARVLTTLGIELDEQADAASALLHCAHTRPQAVLLSARAILDESAIVVTLLREQYRLSVLLALGEGDVERATPAIVAGALPVLDLPLRPAPVLHQLDRVWAERHDPFAVATSDPYLLQLQALTDRIDLTGTEIALLSRLAAGRGRTVSRDSVHGLWPESRDPDGTLVAAIMRLRRKLADVGLGAAIVTVRHVGYRLELSEATDRGSRGLVSA